MQLLEDEMIVLSDAELWDALQSRLMELGNELGDALHVLRGVDAANEAEAKTFDVAFLLEELVERHAPDVALIAFEARNDGMSEEDRRDDLDAVRRRQAARMIRDAMGGDDA